MTDNEIRKPQGGGKKSSMLAMLAVIVVLIIIAGAGWGFYLTKSSTSTSTAQAQNQVTSLAYSHWQAIGVENVSQTASQYTSSSVLYWNVVGSKLNGTYSTTSSIEATWASFFSHDPIDYYSVYNYKISVSVSGNYANVTADLWYLVLINASAKTNLSSGFKYINGTNSVNKTVGTLIMPYLLQYQKVGGTWELMADWWGLPGSSQGHVYPGIIEQFANLKTGSSSSSGGSGGGGGYY